MLQMVNPFAHSYTSAQVSCSSLCGQSSQPWSCASCQSPSGRCFSQEQPQVASCHAGAWCQAAPDGIFCCCRPLSG